MRRMGESGASRGKGCLAFLAFFVVLGVLAGLGFTLWQRTQDDALQERWRARGLPTTLAELNSWYEQVPDEENAAFAFMAASESFAPVLTEEEKQLPYVGGSESRETNFKLTESTLATAQEFLKKNAAAYELAHKAAKLPRARYPFNGNLGPSAVDMQHLAQVRNVARHLWLESLVRAQENNPEGAIASIEAAYALARSVNDEPILIAQLVAIAVKQGTAQAASDTISATQFTREQLDRIGKLAAESSGRDGYYRAIAGEATYGLFGVSAQNPMATSIFVWDRRSYANLVENMLDTSSLSLKEMVSRFDRLYGDLAYSRIRMQIHPLTSIIAPAYVRSSDAMIRAEMYGELLRTVFAIEKYRLEHNALPERLEQLVPESLVAIPEDPYSDGTISYFRENPGYAVYSVGPDRADEQAAKLTGTGGDIALHVKR